MASDSTFEKGFLRLGAVLETIPGRRSDALAAYRRVAGNEVAAKRIAVLEVPRVVTETGMSGIEPNSLDPRRLETFQCTHVLSAHFDAN